MCNVGKIFIASYIVFCVKFRGAIFKLENGNY